MSPISSVVAWTWFECRRKKPQEYRSRNCNGMQNRNPKKSAIKPRYRNFLYSDHLHPWLFFPFLPAVANQQCLCWIEMWEREFSATTLCDGNGRKSCRAFVANKRKSRRKCGGEWPNNGQRQETSEFMKLIFIPYLILIIGSRHRAAQRPADTGRIQVDMGVVDSVAPVHPQLLCRLPFVIQFTCAVLWVIYLFI